MKHAARVLVVLAVAATLLAMGWTASFSWDGVPFIVAIAAWCVSPYGMLWFMAGRREARPAWHAATLLATIACAFFGAWSFVQGFILQPDAQSALLFLFVPLWQWMAVATGIVLGAILASRSPRA